jgi:hypothetical protein
MYSHADNTYTTCSQSIFSRWSFVFFFLRGMFRSALLDGGMWLTSAALNSTRLNTPHYIRITAFFSSRFGHRPLF